MATHFDVFGLSPSFDLDVRELEKRYRALSLQHHPDRVAGSANAKERLRAVSTTTALNEAFQILKDPARRALYLLKLHGLDLTADDASTKAHVPIEFLEEILELREALEGHKHKRDLAMAQAMREKIAEEEQAALSAAAEALRALENKPDPEAVKTAAHALSRMRYYHRFAEEVDAMEEEAL